MTETSPIAAFLQAEDVVSHAGSIGQPASLVDFYIFDEDCSETTTSEVGELAPRGPSVFTGYWNNPDTTATIRRGWFRTSDLVRGRRGLCRSLGRLHAERSRSDYLDARTRRWFPNPQTHFVHREATTHPHRDDPEARTAQAMDGAGQPGLTVRP